MLIAGTNCLEWTDMFLFIHCATLFSSVFVPQDLHDKMGIIFTSMMWTIRPLGALILGFYADKLGRRIPLLTTAFLVMCLTIALIITPTYAQFGMWAFGIFMLIRVTLTFVMAGESTLANVYAFESSKRYEDTCLTITLVDLGASVAGILILSSSLFLVSLGELFSNEYIIRILLALLIITFLFLFKNRLSLTESRLYTTERDLFEDKQSFQKNKKIATILKNKRTLDQWLIYCGITFCYSVSFVIAYVYSHEILKQKLNYSVIDIFGHNLFVIIFELIMQLLFAVIVFQMENKKIFSRRKAIMPLASIFPLLGILLIYYEVQIADNFNVFLFGLGQIFILYMGETLMSGQFLLHFPTIGRARLATSIYAISKVSSFLIAVLLMEYLKAQGGYNVTPCMARR
ncbi:hypothetical protein Bealeia2_02071 (plasmid) [Candidatus Bealeia paramacronuclearis]|uniref:MFS transporter n=1 Tax=Candidatus Bealeia paramacronuclearis TaxID=1921001 RepID=UPI002B7B3AF7|nr:hypothetical protein [Candidatus Bealeia paramacronuclearis]